MTEKHAPEADAPREFAFRQGCLYVHHARGNKLMRVIVHDELEDVLLVKEVATKWDNVEKVAFAIPRSKALQLLAAGKLQAHDECVRPHFLSWADEQLKEKCGKKGDAALAWLKARDDAYEVIRELVEVPLDVEYRAQALTLRLILTFSPETHAQVVAGHATEKGLKPIVIKRLLHKWVWFGMDKNALLNRDPFKGRVDSFPKKYASKTGRPNSAIAAGLDAKHEGRNVTEFDIGIFCKVLKVFYVRMNYTLRHTYEEMKHEYYRGNQHGFFPIRDSRIPTYAQFKYHAVRLINLLNLAAQKAGDKDGKELQERRGRDTDISGAVGEVYDIDATPFNKELVSRWRIDGKTVNIGKATALIVFDRDSKKAIGWHVYVGAENWKEGYRLALFCALTSKARHLKRLGIEEPTAFPEDENIVPSFVYVDGGPGASRSGTSALQRMRIDFKRAPPDTPFWKPTVEGGLGHAQANQANDLGGYDRKNNARSKDKKRNAKLFAAETVYELEKKLVQHLIEYNRALDKKHLLTDEMRVQGVLPSCQAIFSWGVRKMGGVENRRRLESELYMALLEHKENASVTVDGVALFSSRYQSNRLRSTRLQAGRNFPITVMYHPLRLGEAYWVTPDGALDELERVKQDDRKDGEASAYDIETWTVHLNALSIVNRDKKPKRAGKLSARQLEQIRNLAGVPNKKQRKRPSEHEKVIRAVQNAIDANQRSVDRPGAHLPGKLRPQTSMASPPATSGQPTLTTLPVSRPTPAPAPRATATSTPGQSAPPGPSGTSVWAPSGVSGTPSKGGVSSGPSTSVMNTAELFARRRQEAMKKAQDDERG